MPLLPFLRVSREREQTREAGENVTSRVQEGFRPAVCYRRRKILIPIFFLVSREHRYELSQDLLDKQIEMLERKYGGVKARNAALTIQRAFRRYTLLKKFAAITAMAKAEKRLSRKLQEATDRVGNLNDHERMVYHSQIYIQQPQSANR